MWPKRKNPQPRNNPARGRKTGGLPTGEARARDTELHMTLSAAGISMRATGQTIHLRWREGHETSRELAPLLEQIAAGRPRAASVDEFVARIIRSETDTVARGLSLADLYRGAFLHLDAKRGGEWGSFSFDLARYLVVGGAGKYLRLPAYKVREIDDDIQTILAAPPVWPRRGIRICFAQLKPALEFCAVVCGMVRAKIYPRRGLSRGDTIRSATA